APSGGSSTRATSTSCARSPVRWQASSSAASCSGGPRCSSPRSSSRTTSTSVLPSCRSTAPEFKRSSRSSAHWRAGAPRFTRQTVIAAGGRGDLVEEVLAGALEPDEAERVARQAERLGHRLPQRAWVVVLEADEDKTEAALAARGQQDRLDGALSGLVRSRLPGALTLVRSSSAVFLVPDELAPDLPSVEKLGAQIMAAAAPVMKPGSASVGIGNLANGVS